jgi:hypothetical protein
MAPLRDDQCKHAWPVNGKRMHAVVAHCDDNCRNVLIGSDDRARRRRHVSSLRVSAMDGQHRRREADASFWLMRARHHADVHGAQGRGGRRAGKQDKACFSNFIRQTRICVNMT